MGESCAWVSGSLYVRLTVCPRCVHSECIIDDICSVAGKGGRDVFPTCEVEHQRECQVDKWRCPNQVAKG